MGQTHARTVSPQPHQLLCGPTSADFSVFIGSFYTNYVLYIIYAYLYPETFVNIFAAGDITNWILDSSILSNSDYRLLRRIHYDLDQKNSALRIQTGGLYIVYAQVPL